MPAGGQNRKMSPELATIVLDRLAEGYTLIKISEEIDVHVVNIWRYRQNNPDFDASYSHALEAGVESQVDTLLEIADTYEDVNRARLKSDSIKWMATKRVPHKYGDKMTLDVNNTIDLKGALLDARNRLPHLNKPELPQAIDVTPLNELVNTDSESVEAEKSQEQLELEDLLK